jgi:hypothetical protein
MYGGLVMKDSNIMIRVSLEEKRDMMIIAKNKGFDSLSAYLLFLYRNSSNKEVN